MLLGYFAFLVLRSSHSYSSLMDGWVVVGLEIFGSALCLARGFGRRGGRVVPLVLGAAMMSWSIGDAVLTVESLGGATAPTPSLADVFYIGFFPLAYIGIALFMRGEVRRLGTPSWLDSVVAALGAAALCAAFAFHGLVRAADTNTLGVATNLAYPVGDLLLLATVVGASAMLAGRRPMPWILLASGMSVNALGDTFNLFNSTGGTGHIGSLIDAVAWPLSIFLISISMWAHPGHSDPRALQRPQGFLLPGVAGCASLVILVLANAVHVGPVAVSLASATLVAIGVRLAISVRGLRSVTLHRQQQSLSDHLTGLGNRRYMFEILDAYFLEAADPTIGARPLAFLYIDLDGFKEINDSFGHPAGDELLRALGERLSVCVRDSDAFVRLGGDEFAAVLIDAGVEEAKAVAEALTASLEEPFALDTVSVRVGASIGVSLAPSDARDGDSLVSCADLAMYRAKAKATGYALYDADFDDDGNLLRLAEELAEAIEHDGLVLHYQPQLELHSERMLSVEALLRWPHPRLGLIAPLKFLPLAEQAGLMGAVTRWVLDHALAQVASWRAAGSEVVVSVNVSATDLLAPGFTALVDETLRRHGLPPDALVLEITETSLITEFERASVVVDELCAGGVLVSIDDFGTGFTSLTYLSSLAVGELKLDRTFIASLATGDHDRDLRLVRSTIELGHALDMRVVAEGIEDRDTLELLTELGCDILQGYYIGKPKPTEQLPFATPLERAETNPARARSAELVSRRAPGAPRRAPAAT
jgi:diguanylate cyclase (GGDEF)-like protein